MNRINRITLATLAVTGAVTAGAWTMANGAVPPAVSTPAAILVVTDGSQTPIADPSVDVMTSRLEGLQQQVAAALRSREEAAAAAAAAPTAVPVPSTDSAPPAVSPSSSEPDRPAVATAPGIAVPPATAPGNHDQGQTGYDDHGSSVQDD